MTEPQKVSDKERQVIRDVAKRIAEIAAMPEQAEKVRLWTACNDLRPERAMVYADPQGGWEDCNNAWVRLECESDDARWLESCLRNRLVRHEHIPDDFPILDTFTVPMEASGDGYNDYGFDLVTTDSTEAGGAYHIEPVIQKLEDMGGLHFRPVELHPERRDRKAALAEELIGDILKVSPIGRTYWRYGLSRVLIHMVGLSNMMLDMYDKPELIHKLMAFLRDDFMRELDLYESQNAIGLNNSPTDVNGAGGLAPTSDLPGPGFDPNHVRLKDCFCWGESQETVGVGPKQFDEFVLEYQIPLMNRFGLVDYGCCESLDYKLDLLIAKVPHMRWVAVAPWANRKMCAEKIGDKYVYVYKPNPSRVCAPSAEWDAAELDIRETLDIAKGCPVHIVMKDTKTFCEQPERITKWSEMAVNIAKEMA
jgi:hypothetical protein